TVTLSGGLFNDGGFFHIGPNAIVNVAAEEDTTNAADILQSGGQHHVQSMIVGQGGSSTYRMQGGTLSIDQTLFIGSGGGSNSAFLHGGGSVTINNTLNQTTAFALGRNINDIGNYSLGGNAALNVTGNAVFGGTFEAAGGQGRLSLQAGTTMTVSQTLKVW